MTQTLLEFICLPSSCIW